VKIAVRYQSRGGNTKAVAEAIAGFAGVTAEPLDVSIAEPADLLFIGGGVYMRNMDKALKGYLDILSPDMIRSAAVFSTSRGTDGTGKIVEAVKARRIRVHSETLPVKIEKGAALSDEQRQAIEAFVKQATG